MLNEAVETFGVGALDEVRGHGARDKWVFAVIFEVTSAVWGTMDVDRWAIDAGDAHVIGFRAEGNTFSIGEVFIPSGGDVDFGVVGHGLEFL